MGLLNWRDNRHFDHSGDCACTLCGKPTPMRSHRGEPVHKVCAEDWNDRHPDEPRQSTPPDRNGNSTVLGSWRFFSDQAPKKNQGDHA
ncbi:hypothetical protein ACIO7M_05350 [Streptomyces toxytricini]|uniref:Uncharacterized protein n=1 Tax=Streptomyces toxytricini TaxID=67369 RepID=A0ABW8EBC5_STRT5